MTGHQWFCKKCKRIFYRHKSDILQVEHPNPNEFPRNKVVCSTKCQKRLRFKYKFMPRIRINIKIERWKKDGI